VRLLRPRQWVKNVLVLAAPGGAGVLHEPGVLAETALAFVAFSLAASGTYCLNDAADVAADRAHPTKRDRPVADGSVSVPTARLLGVGLLLGRWPSPRWPVARRSPSSSSATSPSPPPTRSG
jgi:decaprenyl-phosphate phosphoribosyltransferase